MNNQKEIWKYVKGYEGYYQISNLGNFRTVSRLVNCKNSKRLIKGLNIKLFTTKGYYRYSFSKSQKRKNIFIHRLVALHFIPNPENKPCVNHIDGNKLNNNITNLEWCTVLENNLHAIKKGLINPPKGKNHWSYGRKGKLSPSAKPVLKFDLKGNLIKRYNSASEAYYLDGYYTSGISSACNNLYKKYKGYVWKFE